MKSPHFKDTNTHLCFSKGSVGSTIGVSLSGVVLGEEGEVGDGDGGFSRSVLGVQLLCLSVCCFTVGESDSSFNMRSIPSN